MDSGKQFLDEEEESTTTGLLCHLNVERPCGPDCMAYLSQVPDGLDYQKPDGVPHQWAHCMSLVHGHKLSKHVVLVANMMKASHHRDSQPSPQQPMLPGVLR